MPPLRQHLEPADQLSFQLATHQPARPALSPLNRVDAKSRSHRSLNSWSTCHVQRPHQSHHVKSSSKCPARQQPSSRASANAVHAIHARRHQRPPRRQQKPRKRRCRSNLAKNYRAKTRKPSTDPTSRLRQTRHPTVPSTAPADDRRFRSSSSQNSTNVSTKTPILVSKMSNELEINHK